MCRPQLISGRLAKNKLRRTNAIPAAVTTVNVLATYIFVLAKSPMHACAAIRAIDQNRVAFGRLYVIDRSANPHDS